MRRSGRLANVAWLAAVAVAATGLAGCIVQGFSPISVDGWEFPPQYPVVSGARQVPLDVDEIPADIPPGTEFACGSDYLGRVRLIYDANAPTHPIRFVSLADEADVVLFWQPGVSARLFDQRAEVIGPDGQILARDGESSLELGGRRDPDGTFHACFLEYLPKFVPTPPPTISE